MTQAWIENLAEDIKQKNRDAYAGLRPCPTLRRLVAMNAAKGVLAFVSCLQEESVDALRHRLPGRSHFSRHYLPGDQAGRGEENHANFPWS